MLHVKHNKIIAEKLNILNLVKNISREINTKKVKKFNEGMLHVKHNKKVKYIKHSKMFL